MIVDIEVTVTDDDIRLGDHNCSTCPVARAINRDMRLVGFCRVTPFTVMFWEGSRHIVNVPLTPVAGRFVAKFDCEPVALRAFKFYLSFTSAELALIRREV